MKIVHIRALIAFAGAPAAWIVQMTIGNVVSSYNCSPHQIPLAPLWAGTHAWLVACDLLCFAGAVFCLFIAYSAWKIARQENVGDGRRRFTALLGLMSSGLFVAAILFTSCAVVLVTPC